MKKVFGVALIMMLSASFAVASNYFDGLSTGAINWIRNEANAAHSNPMDSRVNQASFEGVSIEVSFSEHYGSYWVSRSDIGQNEYHSYGAIIGDLNSAVTSDSLDSMAAEAAASHSSDSSSPSDEPLISAETPIASADKSGLRIAEHVVAPKAKTRSQKEAIASIAGADRPKVIGGNISYEDFSVFGISGDSYEVIASTESATDLFSYGFLLPLSYVEFGDADWSKLGLTAYIKKEFEFGAYSFSAGMNVAAEQTWIDFEDVDDSLSYGAGPMLSFNADLGVLEIGAGVNYQFMDNSEYEEAEILTSALNVGIPIGQDFILNVYGYNVSNLDSDADYWKIGFEATYFTAGIFGFTAGYNKIEDHDFYDSDTYYLGSSWKFA